MLAVTHAVGLIVDELAIAGDRDGAGRHGELLAKRLGNSAHLAALLAVGSAILRLRENSASGDRESCCGGGGEEVPKEVTAGE